MKIQQNLFTLFLIAASASAFQLPNVGNNKQSSSAVDMTATTASFNKDNFDIASVLAQAEAALETAQNAVPKSQSIGDGLAEIVQMQSDLMSASTQNNVGGGGGVDAGKLTKAVTGMEQEDLLAAAFATTAASVVVGSPLVIGAALGVAGSKLLEGENGEQTKQVLGAVGKGLTAKVKDAVAFAKETIDEEDGDISKVPDKMLNILKAKATTITEDVKEKVNPQEMAKQLKEALESDDVKEAPGRAVNAFQSFLASNEVKSVQAKALKALKDGMASDEMKALQNRASEALKETIKSTKQEATE